MGLSKAVRKESQNAAIIVQNLNREDIVKPTHTINDADVQPKPIRKLKVTPISSKRSNNLKIKNTVTDMSVK